MSRTIYVGNLPLDVKERELDDVFYKCGRIVEIDLKLPPRPPGFAFIEFESSYDADEAVHRRDGYDFDGYKLRVSRTIEHFHGSGKKKRKETWVKRTLLQSIGFRVSVHSPRRVNQTKDKERCESANFKRVSTSPVPVSHLSSLLRLATLCCLKLFRRILTMYFFFFLIFLSYFLCVLFRLRSPEVAVGVEIEVAEMAVGVEIEAEEVESRVLETWTFALK